MHFGAPALPLVSEGAAMAGTHAWGPLACCRIRGGRCTEECSNAAGQEAMIVLNVTPKR